MGERYAVPRRGRRQPGTSRRIVRLTVPMTIAEALVDGPHRFVALLRPGHQLGDAVRRGPRDLPTLECRAEAPAAPAPLDDRQAVLGPGDVVGPGQQPGIPNDDPVLERHEGPAGERGLLAQPFVDRDDRGADLEGHVRVALLRECECALEEFGSRGDGREVEVGIGWRGRLICGDGTDLLDLAVDLREAVVDREREGVLVVGMSRGRVEPACLEMVEEDTQDG